MTKRNLAVYAKKSLAMLSSATLLLSSGMTGMFAYADEAPAASGAELEELPSQAVLDEESSGMTNDTVDVPDYIDPAGKATEMYIYDQYGNELSFENNNLPELHIDNLSWAGQDTSVMFKVKIRNPETAAALSDYTIRGWIYYGDDDEEATKESITGSIFGFHKTNEHEAEAYVYISACKAGYKQEKDALTGLTRDKYVETPCRPGKYRVVLAGTGGQVSRNINIVVHEPATDLTIKWKEGGTNFKVNEDNYYNVDSYGQLAVVNRPVYLDTKLTTVHSGEKYEDYLDKVEWGVYEGLYSEYNYKDPGRTTYPYNLVKSDKAVISEDGTFTAKSYGEVWVVAYFKSTEKMAINNERAQRALDAGLIDEMPNFTTNPLTGALSDRPGVIGKKKLSMFKLHIDTDSESPTYNTVQPQEGFSDIYEHDKNTGERKLVTITSDETAIRDHYHDTLLESSDPILEADPNLVNDLPDYDFITNMPKYMRIICLEQNPADPKQLTWKEGKTIDSLEVGKDFQFEINAVPTYNDGTHYTTATDIWDWSVIDPETGAESKSATIDTSGRVKAVKNGTFTVVAQSRDNKESRLEHTVTAYTPATGITFEESSVTVREELSTDISAYMLPETTNDAVEWKSADESVVVVEELDTDAAENVRMAKITGKGIGSAEIIVTAKNSVDPNGDPVQGKFLVTVNAQNRTNEIVLKNGDAEVAEGSTQTIYTQQDLVINASLIGEDGTPADDKVNWTIKDNSGQNVLVKSDTTENLVLQGVSVGTVTVEATAINKGMKKTFKVQVLKSASKYTITRPDGTSISTSRSMPLAADGETPTTLLLGATLVTNDPTAPNDHDDYVDRWESSDPEVASVESRVVSVDSRGRLVKNAEVKALKNGSTTITLYTASGKQASLKINVFTVSNIVLGGVNVNEDGSMDTSITLSKDLLGTKTITATVYDENDKAVTNVDCIWTPFDDELQFYDPGVCTVDSTGKITTLGVGETYIKVKCGSISKTCKLSVYAPLSAAAIEEVQPYTYTPRVEAYEPRPEIKMGDKLLFENIDYSLTYENNEGVGKAKMNITGLGWYTGEKTVSYEIKKRALTDEEISVVYVENYECTGQPIVPEITISCAGDDYLEEGTDYSVAYKNNTKPGTATMTLTGKGNYEGKLEQEFTIYCNHTNLKDTKVVKPADWGVPGEMEGTCAACGEKVYGREIPALVHADHPAATITFDREYYGIEKDETLQLTANGVTSDGLVANDNYRWESSNAKSVTVDENGVVKGIAKGKSTITVYGENDGVKAVCEVAVLTKPTEIRVSPTNVTTREGVEAEVFAQFIPEGSGEEAVWESLTPAIAAVESKTTDTAVVKGVREGTATIRVSGKYTGISSEFTVTVEKARSSDKITISTPIGGEQRNFASSTDATTQTKKIFSSQDVVFTAAIADLSNNPADDVAIWHITDNENDTITLPDNPPNQDVESDSIKIHAASLGECTVTVYPKTSPNTKVTFRLEVAKRCDKLAILNERGESVSSRSLNVGETIKLKEDLTTNDPNNPYNHGDELLEWTSSNPEVASVDPATGVVTANQNGTATITMTTLSEQTKTVKITVFTTSNVYLTKGVTAPENPDDPNAHPTASIVMNKDYEGSNALGATVYDQNEKAVSGSECIWTTSDETIATVDYKGLVTAHDVGDVTIFVQSGAKTEQCSVRITCPVSVFEFDPIQDYIYSPTQTLYEPHPVMKVGSKTLVQGIDYQLTYANSDKVGKATMTITGLGDYYTGTKDVTYNINRRDLSDEEVNVDQIMPQQYTGEKIEPPVHVSCMGVDLVEGTDYKVAYTKNKDEGTATVTISAVSGGNYTGKVTMNFLIQKDNTSIMGDVDGDGVITSADALDVLRASSDMKDLTADQKRLADMDNDGVITSADALDILRKSSGA